MPTPAAVIVSAIAMILLAPASVLTLCPAMNGSAVDITITNIGPDALQLYRLNDQCQEEAVTILQPRRQIVESTFVNKDWLVRNVTSPAMIVDHFTVALTSTPGNLFWVVSSANPHGSFNPSGANDTAGHPSTSSTNKNSSVSNNVTAGAESKQVTSQSNSNSSATSSGLFSWFKPIYLAFLGAALCVIGISFFIWHRFRKSHPKTPSSLHARTHSQKPNNQLSQIGIADTMKMKPILSEGYSSYSNTSHNTKHSDFFEFPNSSVAARDVMGQGYPASTLGPYFEPTSSVLSIEEQVHKHRDSKLRELKILNHSTEILGRLDEASGGSTSIPNGTTTDPSLISSSILHTPMPLHVLSGTHSTHAMATGSKRTSSILSTSINPKDVSTDVSNARHQSLHIGSAQTVWWGYQAKQHDELSVWCGDIVRLNAMFDDGWVMVTTQDDVAGVIPRACLNISHTE
ncbi:hypothetical protein BATDEDRAFT_85667 [Batrachochytrium dendrobatidis JAM81]|uniref:SH3 domain-containing protein n=1 Tax=Batrachochytrium dendrobatidis (strain JAM81 / FGSC 10211) TaxID=684364 RepID=F4NRL2_BATDJ|nr:uncharacterized protein BATDEDRAFT_85667 [Batrachochytrium dendrobatidis JAM81]EGF82941.1 hypothetical protein BATDEDRAFT_85667 [Batrachochytrium dendrobatidis JAM81]|eukprot:XP_006675918.1 hypothetical protein BATDEDRAFT_85667 [Batrachochytrium dendrobatidis JAM81]